MDPEKPPPRTQDPEGCLAVAIRLPVRIVVLVLVVPVRMAWDLLVVVGRVLNDVVLRPLGRALVWAGRAVFVWPLVALWRYAVVPLGRALVVLGHVLLVLPVVALYRFVLTPLGHGLAQVYARVLTPVGHALLWALGQIGAGLVALGGGVYTAVAWLARYLLVVPAGWVYAWILAPFGRAVAWVVRGVVTGVGLALYWVTRIVVVLPAVALWQWVLVPVGRAVAWVVRGVVTGVGLALYWVTRIVVVLPAVALWRWVLAPAGRVLLVVGREVGEALGHAWRIAGHLSLAVGRFLATLFRWIFVEPVRWVYRTVLTPVGHAVRDLVLRPAGQVARAVGRATRQVLTTARESARQARADFRRLLLGAPRPPEAVDRREPPAPETRTLGRSTTALTKD